MKKRKKYGNSKNCEPMKYEVKITNIDYDLDGLDERVVNLLPQQMTAEIEADNEDELEDRIHDHISDRTGFCHKSFDFEVLQKPSLKEREDNLRRKFRTMPMKELKEIYFKLFKYDNRLPELFELIEGKCSESVLREWLIDEQLLGAGLTEKDIHKMEQETI